MANNAGHQWRRDAGTYFAWHALCFGCGEVSQDAFDRTEDLKPLSLSTSDIIAKNAWEWTTTTPAPAVKGKPYEPITLVPLLGHSNQAVKLPKGATLNYTFYSSQSGDARFTIAAIPSYMQDAASAQNMRVSVSIDHAAPVVCQLKEQYNSKQWKLDLWRGQALKSSMLPCLAATIA